MPACSTTSVGADVTRRRVAIVHRPSSPPSASRSSFGPATPTCSRTSVRPPSRWLATPALRTVPALRAVLKRAARPRVLRNVPLLAVRLPALRNVPLRVHRSVPLPVRRVAKLPVIRGALLPAIRAAKRLVIPGCAAPCDDACVETACCPVTDACEIAELIYESQTACYAKDRRRAIQKLGNRYTCVCNPEIMAAFIYALNDADERVRKEAADEIGDQLRKYPCCCSPCVVQALTCALADCDRGVRRQAEEALEACGYEIVDGCCEVACDTTCGSGLCPVVCSGRGSGSPRHRLLLKRFRRWMVLLRLPPRPRRKSRRLTSPSVCRSSRLVRSLPPRARSPVCSASSTEVNADS